MRIRTSFLFAAAIAFAMLGSSICHTQTPSGAPRKPPVASVRSVTDPQQFVRRRLWPVASAVTLNRQLGISGIVSAALVPIPGVAATVMAAGREVIVHAQLVPLVITVLTLELTQMLMFSGSVSSRLWLRNRADYRKRLMVAGYALHVAQRHRPSPKPHRSDGHLVAFNHGRCIGYCLNTPEAAYGFSEMGDRTVCELNRSSAEGGTS